MPPTLLRRARHVITEIERVTRAVHSMRAQDWESVGREMAASHASLRDDFEVSCPEVDRLVELSAPLDGVHGSRMTGAGFGGCTVTLVDTDQVARVSGEIRAGYRQTTGREATCFASRPARGAHRIG